MILKLPNASFFNGVLHQTFVLCNDPKHKNKAEKWNYRCCTVGFPPGQIFPLGEDSP